MKRTTLKQRMLRLKSLSAGTAMLAAAGLLLASPGGALAQTVTTIGGGSVSPPYWGNVNGNTLSTAQFDMPCGMALDSSGNLYVADYTNNAIRLVSSAGI